MLTCTKTRLFRRYHQFTSGKIRRLNHQGLSHSKKTITDAMTTVISKNKIRLRHYPWLNSLPRPWSVCLTDWLRPANGHKRTSRQRLYKTYRYLNRRNDFIRPKATQNHQPGRQQDVFRCGQHNRLLARNCGQLIFGHYLSH